jgi:hypothetical protein
MNFSRKGAKAQSLPDSKQLSFAAFFAPLRRRVRNHFVIQEP